MAISDIIHIVIFVQENKSKTLLKRDTAPYFCYVCSFMRKSNYSENCPSLSSIFFKLRYLTAGFDSL